MTEDNVRVSYGVKELLSRIDSRLESIDGKLDTKADIRDVTQLRERVDTMERRWDSQLAVERDRHNKQSTTFSKREKLAGMFIAVAAVVLQVLPHFNLH